MKKTTKHAAWCVSVVLLPLTFAACQVVPADGLSRDPEQAARTRTAIAAQYIQKGELDAAQRHLQQALEANPRSAAAHNMMGILLQTEGSPMNLQRAEESYRRAIAIEPDFAQAHNNYGVFLSSQKRYEDALRHFEVAGSTLGYEGRAGALENLGRTAMQLGNTARAKVAFEQALQADRGSWVARLELAELLLNQGHLREANRWYEEYQQILGRQPQGARSLWLGMRIARLQQNQPRLQAYALELQRRYPNSDEYQRYLKILQTPGMPWK
ncbi:MAG: type IV pilus biogenesis/stability protein PilW [Pseudomonadota bacterium]|nr:type IV pilus biogenesis/stability protein PilW [Pseudomonadota bacterium]